MAKVIAALAAALLLAGAAWAGLDPVLGPVSDRAPGNKRHLVIVVDFPDVTPTFSPEQIAVRAVERTARWYAAASHGRTTLTTRLCGPYTLPEPLAAYRVSPYNFEVSSDRVYKLASHALSQAERDGVPILEQDVVTVVHRCRTMPGRGYGMICYCANPGMISKVRGGRARYVPIKTASGARFQGGLVVMAENFHLGFLVHDLAHALAGVQDGSRLAQDLYDFELQSTPRQQFHIYDAAIYLGPWDLMSQHFIERRQPPPGFSLFTMTRMGYVDTGQMVIARAGETALARLAPLALGGRTLGMKLPLADGRYLLVENRQRVKVDRMLPAEGVMIYTVDPSLEEGSGQVRAANAGPDAFNFSRAPFGVDGQAKSLYLGQDQGVVIAPLAKLGRDYLVLATGPGHAEDARALARGLARLTGGPELGPRAAEVSRLLRSGDWPGALAAAAR